jgi:RNA polymerase primary sigma factor
MWQREFVRKAIEPGRLKGFVTFDELNELLPSNTATPEDIEAIMEALSSERISVVEND